MTPDDIKAIIKEMKKVFMTRDEFYAMITRLNERFNTIETNIHKLKSHRRN